MLPSRYQQLSWQMEDEQRSRDVLAPIMTPESITVSSLKSRLRKLSPRQRCVVYKSMGWVYNPVDPDAALTSFFMLLGENLHGEYLEQLETAITDVANEKVLDPCIEELKRAVDNLTEEERIALEYNNFDWQRYQGQFFHLKDLQKKTKEMLESIPAELEEYKKRKDAEKRCVTPISIIIRMERLPPHLRAYIYGKMGFKKFTDLDPVTALCKFASDFGRLKEDSQDHIETLTVMDELITNVENASKN